MQLCMFLFQDTDDLVSFWQLIKVELNNLQDAIIHETKRQKYPYFVLA